MPGGVGQLGIGFAALLALSPAMALAQPHTGDRTPLLLEPGERITLGPGRNLDLRVSAVDDAPADAEGPAAPKGATVEHMMAVPLTFHAAPGTLVFTLWDDPDNGARLKLENGLDHWVVYSAEITYRASGHTVPTTICSVGPGKPGIESWPDDVASIQITGLYDAPDSGQVCGNPERGEMSAPPPTVPAP